MVKDLHLYRPIIIFEKNSFIFFIFCSVFRHIILKVTLHNYCVALITAITLAVDDISNKAGYFLKDSHILFSFPTHNPQSYAP